MIPRQMFGEKHITDASLMASASLRSAVKLSAVEAEIVSMTLTTPVICNKEIGFLSLF